MTKRAEEKERAEERTMAAEKEKGNMEAMVVLEGEGERMEEDMVDTVVEKVLGENLVEQGLVGPRALMNSRS